MVHSPRSKPLRKIATPQENSSEATVPAPACVSPAPCR
jgi:hypothetical protein